MVYCWRFQAIFLDLKAKCFGKFWLFRNLKPQILKSCEIGWEILGKTIPFSHYFAWVEGWKFPSCQMFEFLGKWQATNRRSQWKSTSGTGRPRKTRSMMPSRRCGIFDFLPFKNLVTNWNIYSRIFNAISKFGFWITFCVLKARTFMRIK